MLKKIPIVFAGLCGLFVVQNAGAVWESAHTAFSGTYMVYGGYPDAKEARAPSPGDTKVAFLVTGNPAKEVFEAIGPKREIGCPKRGDIRIRERESVLCRHHRQHGYSCNFGFDLSTGLSIGSVTGGAICQN
jgi:hypothetical protein